MTAELVPLVLRFQQGDVDAFATLVDRFGNDLGRFLGHLVPDRGMAQDLLQGLWLKAWTHRKSLKDPAKVKAWLYRIAHREVLMRARSAGTEPSPEEDLDTRASSAAPPEEILIREEDLGQVMAHFEGLPPSFKEILWLALVEEIPHSQIARILDIPEGTCRSRLHHALDKLRKSVNEPGSRAS